MGRFNLAVAVVCAALLSACSGSTPETEKAAIDQLNKTWLEAIVAKDAKKIAELYAEDGQMMPPNAPKAVGREAVQKGWEGVLAIPGVALTFETEKFAVAKSGDLAVEIQTYKFTAGEGAAAATEIGKSVVTWVKRDGKWQVFSDMFSSDSAPMAPAAPQPAATEGAAPATGAPAAPAPTTPAPATPAKPQ